MNFMDELRARRQMYLNALDANPEINLDIFEDFYPDKAHFVFELLQNAEDTGATKCKFTLATDHLELRHNGKRKFNQTDIESITGISNSQRTRSIDAIGRFGVGFKSVFLYTLTPQIHSGEYSFSITSLVMPENIEKLPDLGEDTVFVFPFNNPEKKTAVEAYTEIKQGLEKLSELTLLFLKNIESVAWIIEGHSERRLYRVTHSEFHIEVIKQLYGNDQPNSNFLRFSQPAKGHENQHVSIAFPLARIDDSNTPEIGKPLHEQFRIVAAVPGRVSVFFPAEKETSRLRFHIHGPFVPTVDRSSVKDTAINDPLFDQFASFAAESLHEIRRMELLTPDFLGILPNPQDELPDRYEPIRVAIVTEMLQEDLTPKHGGGFAPANRLVQAKSGSRPLRDLLDKDDLSVLVTPHDAAPEWVVAAAQNNSPSDRFINSLSIRIWGLEEFVTCLKERFYPVDHMYIMGRYTKEHAWLKEKDDAWFQKFYAILWGYISGRNIHEAKRRTQEIKWLSLIKLTDGTLSDVQDCLFLDEHYSTDNQAKWVSKELFSSGDSLNEQKDAHAFLEGMGVRKVGERESLELLIKNRYQPENFRPEIEDIVIFLDHIGRMPEDCKLFDNVSIFKCGDGKWRKADEIYIDEPFSDTGLSSYYQAIKNKSRHPLTPDYTDLNLEIKKFREFAVKIGAIENLEIMPVSCVKNPEWVYLNSADGNKTNQSLDKDFMIECFEEIFDQCDEKMAIIVWDTLTEAEENRSILEYLTATFRLNKNKKSLRQRPSQLVHQLTNTAWVPQQDGKSVAPPFADYKLLSSNFKFDPEWKFINAIKFGSHVASRIEAQEQEDDILRKSFGIENTQSLEDIRELVKIFARLPEDRRRQHLIEAQKELDFELPHNAPKNPGLRGNRVTEKAKNATERITEIRNRSVAVGRDEVKALAKVYLKELYSNDDEIMICQVCRRELPFKLARGGYYFEAVEFLPNLKLRHEQNYITLCPNHAAMFAHANNSKHNLKDMFLGMGAERIIQIDLAGTIHSMLFTKTHKDDLSAVIEAESTLLNPPTS